MAASFPLATTEWRGSTASFQQSGPTPSWTAYADASPPATSIYMAIEIPPYQPIGIRGHPSFMAVADRATAEWYVRSYRLPVLRTSSIPSYYAITFWREGRVCHSLLAERVDGSVDCVDVSGNIYEKYASIQTLMDMIGRIAFTPAVSVLQTEISPAVTPQNSPAGPSKEINWAATATASSIDPK